MRIGIDVGGTFTDIVAIDDVTGQFHYAKTLTTYPNLWEGVLEGIARILDKTGWTMDQVNYIVHGTTIGTNALIEKKGAKTGLITTEGFMDVLEIGRVQRPNEALYDFFIDNPLPLVPRYLRKGVPERVNAEGEVLLPLDEEKVREVLQYFKEQNVESVAVCLLFAFQNPAHERRIAEICAEVFPEAYISLSSEIAPEFREFERSSTTVINAYLQPVMKRYISQLTKELEKKYGKIDLRIMQASGGTITAEAAEKFAINTVNSGPAGGVLAGSFIGNITERKKLISVDMGGTSFDIGLIDGGIPKITSEAKFDGYPIKIPVIDIDAIGAGGGSIAWIDKGGALNVGPQSAGAAPGPSCYGKGGRLPAVTDANLVLGRLNEEYFLGGEMSLRKDLAYQAIKEHVADPLGMSVEEAAAGIIRIINAKMSKGISVNSVEKGSDVREFTLVAFGGAGPLHAVELAVELEMQAVVVPPICGGFSAVGLLVSDVRYDFVQTMIRSSDDIDLGQLNEIYKELEQKGIAQLTAERFNLQDMELVWSVDLRYEGQSYELNVPVDRGENLGKKDVEKIIERFHALHEKLYAYSSQEEEVQFVNLRVTAIGKTPPVEFKTESLTGKNGAEGLKGSRPVYFEGHGFIDTPIYERDRLLSGSRFTGPAVVEETISSTLVTPGASCYVDEFGNLILTWGEV
ncbi:MAG: hydantoinase/oxoprolinase family protein [Bacillota bacterium]